MTIYGMSLNKCEASNNEVLACVAARSNVRSKAGYHIRQDDCARVFQSKPVRNHPDIFDSLPVLSQSHDLCPYSYLYMQHK